MEKESQLVKIPHSELTATLEILSSLGVTQKHFHNLRYNERYRKEVVDVILRERETKMELDDAATILGNNFISPSDVMNNTELGNYSAEQLQFLKNTLPDEEKILELRDQGYTLIPGPPKHMTLKDLFFWRGIMFFMTELEWFNSPKNLFATNEFVKCYWIMHRKKSARISRGKIWDEQVKTLGEGEYIPLAVEVCWVLMLQRIIRERKPNVYLRTSSYNQKGHVMISTSDYGINIVSNYDNVVSKDCGLAIAKKQS